MRKILRKTNRPKELDFSDRIFVEPENYDLMPDLCDAAAAATAIAAGVSALANVGSGVAMVSKKRGTTRMLQVSKELAQYNNELARQNWNLENAYNSPAAQMQRYKEAGLNPNLIYGQQNTAGSIQTGQASLSDAASVLQSGDRYSRALDKIAGSAAVYQDILQRTANIENTGAVTQATKTKAALDAARTEGQVIQNTYQDEMMNHQLEGLRMENAQRAINIESDRIYKDAERKANLLKIEESIRNIKMDTDKKNEEIGKIRADVKSIDQSIEESKARIWQMQEGIKVAYGNLGVAQMNASTNRMNAETNIYNAWTGRYGTYENLNFQKHKFEKEFTHRTLFDYINAGLKADELNFNQKMAFQKGAPQLSPLPFIKGF